MSPFRPPAVAGLFYPAKPSELAQVVGNFIHQQAFLADVRPKALIVPHAGYVYSGSTAAAAYRLLQPLRQVIQRVVLLGPTHRIGIRGLAYPECEGFETPLGQVRLDREAINNLATLPQVISHSPAHEREHSLEVQLPFLQSLLSNFSLIPLAVGDASAEEVAQVLEAIWGGDETLLVISSDLSHFHAAEVARYKDEVTSRQILALKPGLNHDQACGATPINGLLLAARRHRLAPVLLGLCNSGDTAGDPSRVVGYGAFAFSEVPTHVQ